MTEPASIRYNNPGAMWGGQHAERWGAVDDVVLKDGESNHIAVFPTKVQGAAAQFDLWRRAYAGMTIAAAIDKWSGHNSPQAYLNFLVENSGIAADDEVTISILSGPRGIALMKAQAHWEAGEVYPMSDDDWKKAQDMVFPSVPKPPPVSVPTVPPQPQPASGGFFSAINNAILSIFKRS